MWPESWLLSLAACVAFFQVVSALFLRLAVLRKRSCDKWSRRLGIKHIAHRGTRDEGWPENTVAAFNYAVKECGVDCVEFDVWLSADGVPVVFHDPDFNRMCGDDRKVVDVKVKDLPRIRGDVTGQCEKLWALMGRALDGKCKIPTLRETLACLPQEQIFICEFKQDSPELFEEVHKIIEETGRKDHAIWFSLLEPVNAKLRKKDPEIPTIASTVGILKVTAAYWLGLLPFMDVPDPIFGIRVDKVDYGTLRSMVSLRMLPDAALRVLALFGGQPPLCFQSSRFYQHLRARGIPTLVLNVNNEAQLSSALRLGGTGILTDKPLWLKGTDALSSLPTLPTLPTQ